MYRRLLTYMMTAFVALPAYAGQLPASDMDNLAGEAMHFPTDFKGEPTLLILAFAHEQRAEASRVATLLQESQQANPALAWYELPIIDAPVFVHYFITDGMRSKTNAAFQTHVVPQFVDEDEWRQSTGITTKEPVLAKVDNAGMILKSVPLSMIQTGTDISHF